MTQTVVITGASAGIARATARLYGQRGASVGLIARGQAGLDGAVRDVEEAGGKALAISADVDTALASWARDADYPVLFGSDTGSAVGKAYGAYNAQYKLDNRNLFVVGPDGKIAYRATPFREIDPTAYTELGAAINGLVPKE